MNIHSVLAEIFAFYAKQRGNSAAGCQCARCDHATGIEVVFIPTWIPPKKEKKRTNVYQNSPAGL